MANLRQLTWPERLSEDGQKAVYYARSAVSEHGGSSVTDGHLLLGVLRATPALLTGSAELGGAQELSECVMAILASPRLPSGDSEVPLDRAAAQVLNAAVRIADEHGDAAVTTVHILEALRSAGSDEVRSCLERARLLLF